MKNQNTFREITKILVLSILAIVFAIGAYHLLSPSPMTAHAAAKTPPRAGIKTYLRAAPIIVTFEGSRFVANGTDIFRWLSQTGSEVTIDPSGFVNSIANQVNIPVTDSADGRSVDNNALTDEIKENINRGLPGRTIVLRTLVVSHEKDRRIEINLSEQKLYAFEGSNIVNQFLISSGKRGWETPTGEYSVWGKTRSQTMSGPGYRLPNVQWISWFNGEIGIHGTYWHDHFGMPMSHGCINASEPDAEWVYNWDDIGTPVYVRY